VLPRRLYSASAIGLALALLALDRLPADELRRRVSPRRAAPWTAAEGWASLRRWIRAARQGALFAGTPKLTVAATARAAAARIAMALIAASHAAETVPRHVRAFAGAAHVT